MTNFSEKNYLYCNKASNVEQVNDIEIIHVLHYKVALLMRRRSERGTKICRQKLFRKI